MSSDLQSTVAELQFTDYISLVVSSAVVYDYIITFGQEINYIWTRSWSYVTVVFFLVRYLGLVTAVLNALLGSTFIPGPILVSTVLLLLATWSFQIFLAASDIMMILRVYALYAKSKIVLRTLLVLYVSEVVLFCYSADFYNNPSTYLTMTDPQVLDLSFCNPIYHITSKVGTYKYIPRFILAGLLFIFAVARLCMEAFQTYRVTKRWQVNQYVNHLVQDGTLYFFVHLLYIIDFGETTVGTIIAALATILMFTLSSRFIMSVRAMHERNLVHVTGKETGFDAGFGVKSQSGRVSSVGFASPRTGLEAMDNGIQMEETERGGRSEPMMDLE